MKKILLLGVLFITVASNAQVKISALPAQSGSNVGGVLPMTIGGTTKKVDQSTLGQTPTQIDSIINAHTVVRETPSGSVNGSNVTFTLANTPVAGTEQVFKNGILQDAGSGNDYTISSATITFASAPLTGTKIKVTYKK